MVFEEFGISCSFNMSAQQFDDADSASIYDKRLKLLLCVSHPPKSTSTKGTPTSTSRLAIKHPRPKEVSP